MGESAITVERSEPALLLELLVNQNGGVTGLTGVVALRRGDTDNFWLDFADGTFKSAGWATRQASLTEISAANAPGKYVRREDLSLVTIPASTDFLVAEYSVTGSFVGVAQDIIHLVASSKDVPADVDTTLTAAHGAGSWAGLATAPQAIRDAMKLAPTAGAPAVGSVDEHLDDILADTAVIQPLVSTNLDASVSSRGTANPGDAMDLVANAVDAAAVATSGAQEIRDEILSDSIPFAGANVDAAISSRQSEVNAATRAAADATAHLLTQSTGGVGPWTTGAGVTPQAIRDAMKLAPTVGAPAAGSVDEHLDTIEADTAVIEPLVSTNLDAQVSLVETEVAAAARAVTNQTEHDATQTLVNGLNDLSIADVQSALTNQGYTATVAADLAVAIVQIAAVWQIHGLDMANPLTITDTSRTAGTIVQAIVDALASTTVTRTA